MFISYSFEIHLYQISNKYLHLFFAGIGYFIHKINNLDSFEQFL